MHKSKGTAWIAIALVAGAFGWSILEAGRSRHRLDFNESAMVTERLLNVPDDFARQPVPPTETLA